MIESAKAVTPFILIEAPKDEANIGEEEYKDTFTTESSEEDPPAKSLLDCSISTHNLQVLRRPSSSSSLLSSASVQSILTIGNSRGGTLMILFITWVAFIVGLMVGGFSSHILFCESTRDEGSNQTDFGRRHLW